MSKKVKVAGAPALDPTLPKVSLELAGETWQLCFDYAALAIAEQKLAEAGRLINMLVVMDMRELGAERLPFAFFAALVRCHPEITFEKAAGMVTLETAGQIYTKVVDAYVASCPSLSKLKDEKTADPTVEPAAK